ncbi:MAG: hypothetical protein ACRD44_03795 [Bryobacteraceae bacterium]
MERGRMSRKKVAYFVLCAALGLSIDVFSLLRGFLPGPVFAAGPPVEQVIEPAD